LTDEFELYKRMLTIRLLEDELQKLCFTGEAGDLHFSKGQEAISVGACASLNPADYIVTHHRTIAHEIARSASLGPLVAEILGRNTGVNNGMAGEMHIRNPNIRHMFSFQLVGTCISVAAGVAWAAKNFLKQPNIVGCFFGDAATSNAQFHEGVNIASVRKLPLLLLCENNGLAGNIRPEYYLPTKTVTERAAAYGIEAYMIDGNDVLQVVKTVKEVGDKVRADSKPYLIEMTTTRLCWHKQGQRDVRSKEEIDELAKRDPLLLEERRLNITTQLKEHLASEITIEIQKAVAEAKASPYPSFPELA
jgi:pyruvate dehydrogenase E1 component alpha subunit